MNIHAGKLTGNEDVQNKDSDSEDNEGHVDEDHFVIGGR